METLKDHKGKIIGAGVAGIVQRYETIHGLELYLGKDCISTAIYSVVSIPLIKL